MLKESEVKNYFRQEGTVARWWNPEDSDMSHIYTRQIDLVLEWLSSRDNQRVLDASCGKGRVIRDLPHSYEVTGIDISREMLNHVRNLELKHVNIAQADVDHLPIKSGIFDSVICLESLVHYPKPEVALGEFRRVLKPKGLLIVDVDNENSLKRFVKKTGHTMKRLFEEDFQPVSEGIFRAYRQTEFRRLVEQSGFIVKDIAHLGILVPTNLHLPGDKKIIVISRGFSDSMAGVDKFLETFPFTRHLSTYTIVLCQRT